MTVSARLRDIAIAASDDPKQALIDSLGDMTGFEPFHNLVLVATHVGSEKTKGGILLPDKTLAENRFQGKVGLVIAIGPQAFTDDERVKFGGVKVKVGDWVMYRPADGMELFFVNETGHEGTPCRLLEDVSIKGRIADPSKIF